jgi:NAD(P)-dependent dehydrogenase (short-subunit alcohol dehydrogenase family)
MTGRVCLVTGATSGLGFETAVGLAKLGATVAITARTREKGEVARREVRRRANADTELYVADLALMADVRRLAAEVSSRHPVLHVLVNNAGLKLGRRTVTAEGFDTVLATNYLSPFLLTGLLLDRLKAGAPARVVNVSSMTHFKARFDPADLADGGFARGTFRHAYSRTKLMLAMWSHELAERLAGTGVTVNAMCPGGVATGIWKRERGFVPAVTGMLMGALLKGPESAARLPVRLAAAPELEGATGLYFQVRAHTPWQSWDPAKTGERSAPATYDKAARQVLWEATENLLAGK